MSPERLEEIKKFAKELPVLQELLTAMMKEGKRRRALARPEESTGFAVMARPV